MKETEFNPNYEEMCAIYDALDSPRFAISIRDEITTLSESSRLGSGGTKTVYEISLKSKKFALALPTITDPHAMIGKWEKALKEPENTQRLRNLGLIVNPISEIIPVEIASIKLPAILMLRYQDLGFGVLDGRNNNSSTIRGAILPSKLTRHIFQEYLFSVIQDVRILVNNQIKVSSDSFNVAVIDNKPRVYLNDLGLPKYSELPWGSNKNRTYAYLTYFTDALRNGLHWQEYDRHEDFFHDVFMNRETTFEFLKPLTKAVLAG